MFSPDKRGTGSSTEMVRLCDDVAGWLSLIFEKYSEIDPAVPSKDQCSPIANDRTQRLTACLICGRDTTSTSPSATQRMGSQPVVETKKLCGSQDLCNILLLITPAELPSPQRNCYKVHRYCLYSHIHLGVDTLTDEELQMVEQYHRSDLYTIVYCSGYIQLDDAVRNTPIKAQIFKIVREESKAVRRTWYRGNMVGLSYRSSRTMGVGVIPIQNTYGIQSLERPRIPVRMRQLPSDKIANHRRSLRQNLQREFYFNSQKSMAKIYVKCTKCTETLRTKKRRKRIGPTIKPKLQGVALKGDSIFEAGCSKKTKKQAKDETLKKPGLCQNKLPNTTRRPKVKDISPKNEEEVIPTKLKGTKDKRKSRHQITSSPVDEMDLMEEVPGVGVDDMQVLWGPHKLRESIGDIPSMIPSIESQESTNVLMDPPKQQKNRLKLDFPKFLLLVEQINEQLCPREEDLLTFFQIAEFHDFKMYVRHECSFPCWAPPTAQRYRIECYVLDDRRDFIASIALLCSQLDIVARHCPGATRNIRFVDNAFDLTTMPLVLTSWLKTALNAIHARPIYNFLGELTYNWARPQATLMDIPTKPTSEK